MDANEIKQMYEERKTVLVEVTNRKDELRHADKSILNGICEIEGNISKDTIGIFKDVTKLKGVKLVERISRNDNYTDLFTPKSIYNLNLKLTIPMWKTLKHIANNLTPELLSEYNIKNRDDKKDYDIVDDMLSILISSLKDIYAYISKDIETTKTGSVEKGTRKITKVFSKDSNDNIYIEILCHKMYRRRHMEFLLNVIEKGKVGYFYEEVNDTMIEQHLETPIEKIGTDSKYINYMMNEFLTMSVIDDDIFENTSGDQMTKSFILRYNQDLKKLINSVSYRKYDVGNK